MSESLVEPSRRFIEEVTASLEENGPNVPRTSQSSSSLTRRSIVTSPQTRLKASSATSPRRRSACTEATPRLTSSREAVTSSMKRRLG